MVVLLAALLVLALAALGGAALRWARGLGADGLALPLAAAPLAAGTAVVSALALGVVGLGGSPVALAAAALAAYAVTRAAGLPAAVPGAALRDGWHARTTGERIALGAAAGALAAWTAWVLRTPGLGIDPLSYHLPESIIWVQEGTPGSVERLQYDFPQGNYPLTGEVLVAWLIGIARGVGPALLWVPVTAALAALAGWTGLRAAGAAKVPAALAVLAVLLAPVASSQLIGPHTDLPALAWLWTAAALVVLADREPRLLAPALVAAALAVGTKTTAAPLALLLLAAAAVRHRHRLRRLAPLLAAATALAVAAGGVWYLRNLVQHGSPLYPFKALPWGDPVPEFLARLDVAFLDRPGETLDRNATAYRRALAGGLAVLALGLLAPLLRRSKGTLTAAAAAAAALATWLTAPFTGAAADPVLDVSATTSRYLLPAISAAAVAAALAARGRARVPVAVALALAAAWSLREAQHLPVLAAPSTATLAAGVLAGALLAAVAARLPGVRVLAAGAAAAAVALATVATTTFTERHAATGYLPSTALVGWAAGQAAWQDGDFPVAFAPQIVAPLAGETFEHPIALVPREASCADVARRARAGWVVLGTFAFADRRAPFTADDCLTPPPPGTRVLYRDPSFTVVGPAPG